VKDVPSYEMMYLMIPNLEDEAYEAVNQRFSDLIAENGGRIGKIDVWGKRRLAYEINKWREGFYTVIYFEAPADVAKELDRVLKINEDVLRHIIIRREDESTAVVKGKEAAAEDVK
jgi:small subunit ribosomal protein S6